MRKRPPSELAVILGYLAVTVVLGSLLAPWLFQGGKLLVDRGTLETSWLGWLHDAMDRADFSRFYNRAMMIAAVAGLVPAVRLLRIGSSSGFGLDRNPVWGPDFLAGFLLACGFLLLLGGALLHFDFYVPEADPDWGRLPGIAASALAVGFFEEWFFRGALFALFLRRFSTLGAAGATTFLYAALHFLKPPDSEIDAGAIRWDSGFELTGQIFHRFAEPQELLAEFSTLLLIGAVLIMARLHTRSLWLPIGLHAGWVFGLKVYQRLTDKGHGLRDAMPWLGDSIKSGLAPLGVICITGLFVRLWIHLSRESEPEPS